MCVYVPLRRFLQCLGDGDSDAALLCNSPEYPQAAAGTLFNPFISFVRSNKLGLALVMKVLRRDGDSNPGNTFGVYTLSRRASSTTRASLLRRNWLATKFVARRQRVAAVAPLRSANTLPVYVPICFFITYKERTIFIIGYKSTTKISHTQIFFNIFAILYPKALLRLLLFARIFVR